MPRLPFTKEMRAALRQLTPGAMLPGTALGRTAFFIMWQPAQLPALMRQPGSRVPIGLRLEGHARAEGVVVRVLATFHAEADAFTLETFLHPVEDWPLLDALTRQETVEFYFFAPGQLQRPFLSKQMRWPEGNRAEARQIQEVIRREIQQYGLGDFAASKAAVQRDQPLIPVGDPRLRPVAPREAAALHNPAFYGEVLAPTAVVEAQVAALNQQLAAQRQASADAYQTYPLGELEQAYARLFTRLVESGQCHRVPNVQTPPVGTKQQWLTIQQQEITALSTGQVFVVMEEAAPERGAAPPFSAPAQPLLRQEDYLLPGQQFPPDLAVGGPAPLTYADWDQADRHQPVAGIHIFSAPLSGMAQGPAVLDVRELQHYGWSIAQEGTLRAVAESRHLPRLSGIAAVDTANLAAEGAVDLTKPTGPVLLYFWGVRSDPLQALRALVENVTQRGEHLPWPVVAALFAALQVRRQGHPPHLWAAVTRAFLREMAILSPAPPAAAPIPARRVIETQARQWLTQRQEHLFPQNAYARALFCWEVGRLILEQPQHWPGPDEAGLAEPVLRARAGPWRLPLPDNNYLELAAEETADPTGHFIEFWLALGWLSAQRVSTGALGFILPHRRIRPRPYAPLAITGLRRDSPVEPEADPALLRGFADELVREANANAAYSPVGALRVLVPADNCLYAWGVRELRLYIEPAAPLRVWVGTVAAADEPPYLFAWEAQVAPREHDRSPRLSELGHLAPSIEQDVLDLFLAALWYDLRVQGPTVFVSRGRARTGAAVRLTPAGAQSPAAPAPRTMPRRRALRLTDVLPPQSWTPGGDVPHEWGAEHERAAWRQRRVGSITPYYRTWTYRDECRIAVLLAAQAHPPQEYWRERLAAAAQDRLDALTVIVKALGVPELAGGLDPVQAVLRRGGGDAQAEDLADTLTAARSRWPAGQEDALQTFCTALRQADGLASDEMIWWRTLLSLGGTAERRETQRVAALRSGLERLPQRFPHRQRLAKWAAAGLAALEETEEADIAAVLASTQTRLETVRAAARERAHQWGWLPPPAGRTFVRPHLPSSAVATDATAPLVRATSGLRVVQEILQPKVAAPETPAVALPATPDSKED